MTDDAPAGGPPPPSRPTLPPQSGAAWAIDVGLGVGCAVALVVLVAFVARPSSAAVAGELTGKLVLPVVAVGTFAMRMRRARKWLWASVGVLVVLAAFALMLVPAVVGRMRGANEEHVLTAADRRALERVQRDGTSWLVQRKLGFELLDPGANFRPDPSTSDTMMQQAGAAMRPFMHAYSHAEHGLGALNIVILARQGIDDHVDEVFRGVSDGFRRQVGSSAREERSGSGMRTRMDLRGEVQGITMRARVLVVPRPASHHSVVLNVSIVPADEAALVRSLESVRALRASP